MKKIFAVVFGAFALGIFLPARAEVAPSYYYDEPVEEAAADTEEQEPVASGTTAPVAVAPSQIVAPASSSARSGANIRRMSGNAAPAAGRQGAANTAGSRAVSARAAVTPVVRSANNSVPSTAANARPVASRTVAQSRGNAGIQSRTTGRTRSAANAITNIAAPSNAQSAPQERRVQARAASNGALYNAARVGTTGSVMSAGTRSMGTLAGRSASLPPLFNSNNTTTTAAASTSDTAAAEELAAKTEFCKSQYLNCMDGFCAVLDDNSGRCTCSENIKKYEKVEAALKQAAIDLQDIATKIKYLGLSKDDVTSLFTQTEAEQAMSSSNDASTIKLDLDKIQKLLIDPTSAAQVAAGSGSISFNIDALSLGGDFDWGSFLTGESSSIQNQRGKMLYETAYGKCTSVLTNCKADDVDISLIQTNYDIEIDKQCVAYERALTDANDTMKSTIRNATTVLQQARLLVAQNKNKYDIKGCVSALDSCMVDSFVCGDDYENCLDKSGQYIISGNIIVGSEPNETTGAGGIKGNWKFGQSNYAFDDGKTVMEMVASALTPSTQDNNLATMLHARIGNIDSNGKISGMCAGVMNQCRNYTYNNDQYKDGNEVVKEYLIRTLQKIKGRQDDVLATYGESCRQDIISCFSKNGASSSSPSQPLTTAVSACMTYIKTCASVNEISTFSGDVASYVCPMVKPDLVKNANNWVCTAPTCPTGSTADATATVVGNGVNGGKAVPMVGCRCTAATHTILVDGACATP